MLPAFIIESIRKRQDKVVYEQPSLPIPEPDLLPIPDKEPDLNGQIIILQFSGMVVNAQM